MQKQKATKVIDISKPFVLFGYVLAIGVAGYLILAAYAIVTQPSFAELDAQAVNICRAACEAEGRISDHIMPIDPYSSGNKLAGGWRCQCRDLPTTPYSKNYPEGEKQ